MFDSPDSNLSSIHEKNFAYEAMTQQRSLHVYVTIHVQSLQYLIRRKVFQIIHSYLDRFIHGKLSVIINPY